MTVQAARRPRRRAASKDLPAAPGASMAIGEIDQTVFDCPSCARPLALGARRCPGCRTRIVGGVTFSKASRFVAVGLAVGLLTGGGVGFVAGAGRSSGGGAIAILPANMPSGAPASGTAGTTPSQAPTAGATARPSATPAATPGGITPSAKAALGQVGGTNARLAASAATLRDALSTGPFDASDVARVLRSISADSLFGEQLGARVSGWSGTAATGETLTAFYAGVHDIAVAGLVSSVRNEAAYRAAATAMVAHLEALGKIDAAVAAAARSAGIELPVASPTP